MVFFPPFHLIYRPISTAIDWHQLTITQMLPVWFTFSKRKRKEKQINIVILVYWRKCKWNATMYALAYFESHCVVDSIFRPSLRCCAPVCVCVRVSECECVCVYLSLVFFSFSFNFISFHLVYLQFHCTSLHWSWSTFSAFSLLFRRARCETTRSLLLCWWNSIWMFLFRKKNIFFKILFGGDFCRHFFRKKVHFFWSFVWIFANISNSSAI